MTDAGTKSPIAGLQVCVGAMPEDGSFVSRCVMTDSAGNYTMELAPHGYVVEFQGEPLGYGRQWFDHTDHRWLRETLDIGSDPISGIDAAMKPLGRIEGVVKEEGDGTYSKVGLPPGEYKIEFLPMSPVWQTQYWDHKQTMEEATPISLAAGTITSGIDADIVLTPKPDSSSGSAPTSLIAPAPLAPVLSSPPFKNRLCPKGYRAKRVSGKRRCVCRHKHHRHRRHR